MEIIDSNESNGTNNYYIVRDRDDRKYVVMHVVNGKFAVYDYEFHEIVSSFRWSPNNGYACCVLRDHNFERFPDLPFEVNKICYMHVLIKEYCLKEPKENEKHVLHHVNERRRDNRKENLVWISRNQQRALLKKIGKLGKPPVEIRPIMPELPKFCRWINAKKAFWISDHPACFLAVENKEQKHKYIESKKGKKHTVMEKFEDFLQKYDAMMSKPYNGHESFYKFLEFQHGMIESYKELTLQASSRAMMGVASESFDCVDTQEGDVYATEDVDSEPSDEEDDCGDAVED